jgi:hypothetical protein
MPEGRWGRLAADLRAAGFEVRLDEKPYSEIYRGRARHGVTISVTYRVPGKGLVVAHDIWWNKNPDVWVGWEVYAEGTDSIVVGGPSRWSKKRSEVVTAFRSAVSMLGSAGG